MGYVIVGGICLLIGSVIGIFITSLLTASKINSVIDLLEEDE